MYFQSRGEFRDSLMLAHITLPGLLLSVRVLHVGVKFFSAEEWK